MDFQEFRATSVDPRYVTEEIRSPVYRVDFWDRNRDSDEFRLENADPYFDTFPSREH